MGTVHQKVTENYRLSNGPKRDCLRETREDNTLVVGGFTLSGSNAFLVGPVDPKLCAE